MSDQRKNKSRSPGPTREKLSESDRLARALRKHFDRAAAEAIWCVRHVQESIRSGQCAPTVDVKSLCGEHWQPMWKEWRAVARLCRRQAEIERRTGHPVVLAILSVVADKLTRPGNPIKALSDAIELLTWLPSPSISVRNPQAEALEEIARYPVLDWPAKADVLKQIRTKHGRPRTTRGLAAQALELRGAGESWAEIEKELLPDRQKVANPGEAIRGDAQHLKALLRRHGFSLT